MKEFKEFLAVLLFGTLFYVASLVFMSSAHADGTGVFVSKDGYIMTNQHVVDNHKSYYTVEYHGKAYHAVVVSYGRGIDLALLKITENTTCLRVMPAHIKLFDTLKSLQFDLRKGYDNIENGRVTFRIHVLDRSVIPFFELLNNGSVFVDYFWFEPVTRPGNSGSPILDSNNDIVSITFMGLEEPNGKTIKSAGMINTHVVEFKNANPQILCERPAHNIGDTLVWIKEARA